ncbi:MAG TPA: EAL domain-containing protein [Rhizomicrobium sp.]|nr:EAL domain-containing protein [Rhizomicrobium sp.]
MPRLIVILAALTGALFAGIALAAGGKPAINFADPNPAIELKPLLAPYHASSAPESDGSLWYVINVANNTVKPATRILVAGQPADAALHFFPRSTRPFMQQVASSDGGISVEKARAFGRHAFRVIIPPATTAALAIRLSNADSPPSLLAWNEPTLVDNNRQLAVFMAAVAGLIAAALAITAGLAVMTAHPAPRWAALALLGALLGRIATTGMFDSGWDTAVGGPYGLSAMFAGLALAAGIRLADIVTPLETVWPQQAVQWRKWGLYGLVALSLLAFIGLPGATLLLEPIIVFGTAGVTAYLVHQGRMGRQAARVIAPSAAVFALVTLAGAIAALGGFRGNPMAPAMIGGFVAAGAVLLALAVAAGEGIAILPGLRPAAPPLPEGPPPREFGHSPAALQAIGASHQGIFDLDFRGGIVRLSADAAGLIGLSGAQNMPHAGWEARIHPEDRDTYSQALADYRTHPGLAFRIEFRVRSESGRYPWFELRATMLGEGTEAHRCLGLMADVTARKESEAAVIDRTLHDPLTGLGNRVALMEELDQLGERLSTVAFALLDIDRFKSIHASLGDAGADDILISIAQRLLKRFTDVAHVFRVGGDAFALLFADGGTGAAAIGADLIDVCSAPFPLQGRNVFAPASAGIVAGGDARDPFELLRNAELALLHAKRAGGGCARIYTPDLEALAPGDAVALEADLRRALEENQVDVFYQPIMRLADETVVGFEALMRWHHPTKGLVSPVDFIAHSEQTGLIVTLGKFALKRAASDLSRWQQYFPIEPALFVNVNVSRRQLRDTEFEKFLGDLLARAEIKPGTLKLEVTESAVAAGEDIRATLGRIRDLGAGIAIDDFGTGLSTLSQLKDIPFDTLKIDKSFLAAHEDAEGALVLGSIISLAHELKRVVVVEGAETARDAERLRELGCEFAQGFLFGAAMPAAEALNFIALHYKASRAPGIGG